MKVLKTLISIIFVTIAALLYVHQQVELVKISYAIECKEHKLKDMLDQRESLDYNINHLQDPSRMEQVLLSNKIGVAFPKRANVVTVAGLKSRALTEERLKAIGVENRINFLGLFDFLGQGKEAQAKER